MKKYAILIGDEDGHNFVELSSEKVGDIKRLMEDYGVEEWLDKHEDDDPNYWPTDKAVLIRYEVVVPKKVKVVEKYEIEG